MALKRFPIGVQDFARIREDGMYYVDKTDLVYKLTHTDLYYFLSRPRRFGKSLLVSTLQYYFEGRKDLFSGLAMEKKTGGHTQPKTRRMGTPVWAYATRNPIPMLYQSGYLTIKSTKAGNRYVIGFPNNEVRLGFLKALMPYYAMDDVVDNDSFLLRFVDALEEKDIEKALVQIRAFMSGIPYNAEHKDENHYKAPQTTH